MHTTVISIKDARNRFAELIERASLTGETFIVTKFNKPRAVITDLSSIGKPTALSALKKMSDAPYEGSVPSDLSTNDTYLYGK
ncbi:MAG: type II toxin-antitoxin system Phd/YefM family antitoxin [Parcubacteria group bacterium]